MFRKDTRLTPTKIFEALEAAARNVVGIGIACAIAGVVVGVVTLTGLGITFANAMISMANIIGHDALRMVAVLFFCMLASLILGMGVPTTAKYVIMATVTAPILVRLEVPLLAAHMFVFYFGTDADITPPVALASYAGAAIAKGDPMKTSIIAAKLAVAAYIIPYIFVFNTQLLFIDPDVFAIAKTTIAGTIGIIGVAAGVTGYFAKPLPWYLRIVCVSSAFLLVSPDITTDLIGAGIVAGIYIWQKYISKDTDGTAVAVA
jgi:TRAP transporter 4TM/12TM fusion protein